MSRRPRMSPWAGELLLLALIAGALAAIYAYGVGLHRVATAAMAPRLLPGDIVLVAKLPREAPPRGAILLVRDGGAEGQAALRRVIGLPGDRVALRAGRLVHDGKALPRWRIADLILPETPATPCPTRAARERREGAAVCRFRRYREMLPGGALLDTVAGAGTAATRPTVRVPAGGLLLMDDARGSAGGAGGWSLIGGDAVIGRASVILFSTDGTARLDTPATWAPAIRAGRIGTRF